MSDNREVTGVIDAKHVDELIAAIDRFATEVRSGAWPDGQAPPPDTRAFKAVVVPFAWTFSRYGMHEGIQLGEIALFEPAGHLRSLWSKNGFRERALSSSFDARAEQQRIAEAVLQPTKRLTTLAVVDGLDMPPGDWAINDDVRLVELTSAFLDEWLRGHNLPGTVNRDLVERLHAFEIKSSDENPPWGYLRFDLLSDAQRIRSAVDPWLSLVNLVDQGKVRAPVMYQRTESLLVEVPVRAVGDAAPIWYDASFYDEYDDLIPGNRPHVTLRIDDGQQLATRLQRLYDGWQRALGAGHRVETSRRFFDRAAQTFWTQFSHGMPDDADAAEDLIVDAVTALEAIYLDRNCAKSKPLQMRAAPFLEGNKRRAAKLRTDIEELYDVRSDIVHGAPPHGIAKLSANARFAEQLMRRSLRSFLLAGGDNDRIVRASKDPAVAKQLRADADFDAIRPGTFEISTNIDQISLDTIREPSSPRFETPPSTVPEAY